MSDPLSHSRLPDLPHAGYGSAKARELSDAMMFLLRGMERDRPLLLETVIQGQMLWRKRFVKAFRVIHADTDFADAVFGYLVLLAGPNPHAQQAILQGQAQQAAVTRWDKRLSTLMRGAKDAQSLLKDIQREQQRPTRIYGKH